MKKLKTLTIGIPVYNEEANIRKLILSLLAQKQTNFILERIIVISDGSNDQTVKKVKRLRSKKVYLLENVKRWGLNKTQNKILSIAKSDILVIANGDILIEDYNLINKIAQPFYENQNLGIVSTPMEAIRSSSFIGKTLVYMQVFKEELYKRINNSDNVYLCHGQLRAFSKKFYSKFKWEENCPEDSFSYFTCIKKGFQFQYLSDLTVFYKTSQTIGDHILQSNRFIFGIDVLKEIFGKRYIEKSYQIPQMTFVATFLYFLLRNPILILSYLFMMIYIRFFRKIPPVHHSRFEVATTSKIVTGLLFFDI